MSDLNISERSGRLVDAPERINGTLVKFTLAVNRKENKADFFDYIAYEPIATRISQYCRKGTKIVIVGRDETGSYKDKKGIWHKSFSTIVKEWHFCESKKDNQTDKQMMDEEPDVYNPADDDLPF